MSNNIPDFNDVDFSAFDIPTNPVLNDGSASVPPVDASLPPPPSQAATDNSAPQHQAAQHDHDDDGIRIDDDDDYLAQDEGLGDDNSSTNFGIHPETTSDFTTLAYETQQEEDRVRYEARLPKDIEYSLLKQRWKIDDQAHKCHFRDSFIKTLETHTELPHPQQPPPDSKFTIPTMDLISELLTKPFLRSCATLTDKERKPARSLHNIYEHDPFIADRAQLEVFLDQLATIRNIVDLWVKKGVSLDRKLKETNLSVIGKQLLDSHNTSPDQVSNLFHDMHAIGEFMLPAWRFQHGWLRYERAVPSSTDSKAAVYRLATRAERILRCSAKELPERIQEEMAKFHDALDPQLVQAELRTKICGTRDLSMAKQYAESIYHMIVTWNAHLSAADRFILSRKKIVTLLHRKYPDTDRYPFASIATGNVLKWAEHFNQWRKASSTNGGTNIPWDVIARTLLPTTTRTEILEWLTILLPDSEKQELERRKAKAQEDASSIAGVVTPQALQNCRDTYTVTFLGKKRTEMGATLYGNTLEEIIAEFLGHCTRYASHVKGGDFLDDAATTSIRIEEREGAGLVHPSIVRSQTFQCDKGAGGKQILVTVGLRMARYQTVSHGVLTTVDDERDESGEELPAVLRMLGQQNSSVMISFGGENFQYNCGTKRIIGDMSVYANQVVNVDLLPDFDNDGVEFQPLFMLVQKADTFREFFDKHLSTVVQERASLLLEGYEFEYELTKNEGAQNVSAGIPPTLLRRLTPKMLECLPRTKQIRAKWLEDKLLTRESTMGAKLAEMLEHQTKTQQTTASSKANNHSNHTGNQVDSGAEVDKTTASAVGKSIFIVTADEVNTIRMQLREIDIQLEELYFDETSFAARLKQIRQLQLSSQVTFVLAIFDGGVDRTAALELCEVVANGVVRLIAEGTAQRVNDFRAASHPCVEFSEKASLMDRTKFISVSRTAASSVGWSAHLLTDVNAIPMNQMPVPKINSWKEQLRGCLSRVRSASFTQPYDALIFLSGSFVQEDLEPKLSDHIASAMGGFEAFSQALQRATELTFREGEGVGSLAVITHANILSSDKRRNVVERFFPIGAGVKRDRASRILIFILPVMDPNDLTFPTLGTINVYHIYIASTLKGLPFSSADFPEVPTSLPQAMISPGDCFWLSPSLEWLSPKTRTEWYLRSVCNIADTSRLPINNCYLHEDDFRVHLDSSNPDIKYETLNEAQEYQTHAANIRSKYDIHYVALADNWSTEMLLSREQLTSLIALVDGPLRLLSLMKPQAIFDNLFDPSNGARDQPWLARLREALSDPVLVHVMTPLWEKNRAPMLDHLSVLRWRLISNGQLGIPFDSSDLQRCVKCGITMEIPEVMRKDTVASNASLIKFIELVKQIEEPLHPDDVLCSQPALREYFLKDCNVPQVILSDTSTFGSALLRVLVKGDATLCTSRLMKNSMIETLRRWYSDHLCSLDADSKLQLKDLVQNYMTQHARATLVMLARSPRHCEVLWEAMTEDQRQRVETESSLPCHDSFVWWCERLTKMGHSFDSIQQQRHSCELTAIISFMTHKTLDGTLADNQTVPLSYVPELTSIFLSAIRSKALDDVHNAIHCIQQHLNAFGQVTLLRESQKKDENITITVALMLLCPSEPVAIPSDDEAQLSIFTKMTSVLKVDAAIARAFKEAVESNLTSASAIAKLITGHLEYVELPVYNQLASLHKGSKIEPSVLHLVKQVEPWPDYPLQYYYRPLPDVQIKRLFSTGRYTPAAVVHYASHLKLAHGISFTTIQANIDVLLGVHTPAPVVRVENAQDILALRSSALLWFHCIGITVVEQLAAAIVNNPVAALKKLMSDVGNQKQGQSETVVWTPMPACFDLKVSAPPGLTELFGEGDDNKLFTLTMLSSVMSVVPPCAGEPPIPSPEEAKAMSYEDLLVSCTKVMGYRFLQCMTAPGKGGANPSSNIEMTIVVQSLVSFSQDIYRRNELFAKIYVRSLSTSLFTPSSMQATFPMDKRPALITAIARDVVLSISMSQAWSVVLINEVITAAVQENIVFPIHVRNELCFAVGQWGLKDLSVGRLTNLEVLVTKQRAAHREMHEVLCPWQKPPYAAPQEFLALDNAGDPAGSGGASSSNSGTVKKDFAKLPSGEPFLVHKPLAAASHNISDVGGGSGDADDAVGLPQGEPGYLIDIRKLLELDVPKVSEEYLNFATLQLKPAHDCFLVQRNGFKEVVTETPAANDKVLQTFPNSSVAWNSCVNAARPCTLVGDGFFLYKTLNNRFAMYSSSNSEVYLWDVLNNHRLLSIALDELDLDVCVAVMALTRLMLCDHDVAAAQRIDTDSIEAHVRELAAKSSDPSKIVQRTYDVARTFLRNFLDQNRFTGGDAADAIASAIEESGNDDVTTALGIGGEQAANARLLRLYKVFQNTIDKSSREKVRDLLDIDSLIKSLATQRSSSHPSDPASPTAGASPVSGFGASATSHHSAFGQFAGYLAFTPSDVGHIPKVTCRWLNDHKDKHVGVLSKIIGAPATEDYSQPTGEVTDNLKIAPCVENGFGYGDKQPRFDRINYSVSCGDRPAVYCTILDRVEETCGRQIVAVMYDCTIIRVARKQMQAIVDKRTITQDEKNDTMNSFIADFERWVVQLLVSPLTIDRKSWFLRHVLTYNGGSDWDEIRARLQETLSTQIITFCIARRLPLPDLSKVLMKATPLPPNVTAACERKNDLYGMVLRAKGNPYDDTGIRKITTSARFRPPSDADFYLNVIGMFTDFITHVVITDLPAADDVLLKWFAEYTFRYPWRFVVFYDIDTTDNVPEVRDRLYFAAGARQTLLVDSHNTTTVNFEEWKQYDVAAEVAAWIAMCGQGSTVNITRFNSGWQAFMKKEYLTEDRSASGGSPGTLIHVVTPPGAGKSFLMQRLMKLMAETHLIFELDCSNDRLVQESLKSLLMRHCPSDKKVFFIGDEYHFLKSKKKREMFSFFARHLPHLVVVLIANRMEGEDDKLIEKLKARWPNSRIETVRGHLDEKSLRDVINSRELVPITDDQRRNEVRRYVGAFHCARRLVFSDNACSLRDRGDIVSAALEGGKKLDVLVEKVSDKLVQAGKFAASFVRTFHALVKATGSPFEKYDVVPKDEYLRFLQTRMHDPEELIVCIGLACTTMSLGDASVDRRRDRIKTFAELVEALPKPNNCTSQYIHPANRLTLWAFHVLHYFDITPPDAFTPTQVQATFLKLRIVDQINFPVIESSASDSAGTLAMCKAIKYRGNFTDLLWVLDCVKRQKALDWENDVSEAWRLSFVSDVTTLTSIIGASPNKKAVVEALDPRNLDGILRSQSLNQSLTKMVMTVYPEERIALEQNRLCSPYFTTLWRSFRECEYNSAIEWQCMDPVAAWLENVANAVKDRSPIAAVLLWVSRFAMHVRSAPSHVEERCKRLSELVCNELRDCTAPGAPLEKLQLLRPIFASSNLAGLVVPGEKLTMPAAYSIAAQAALPPMAWCSGMKLLWELSHRQANAEAVADVLEWLEQLGEDAFPELIGACLMAHPAGCLSAPVQSRLAICNLTIHRHHLPVDATQRDSEADRRMVVLKNMSSVIRNAVPLELKGEVGMMIKEKREEFIKEFV